MSCHVMVSWRVSLLMRFWSLPQPNTLDASKPSQGRTVRGSDGRCWKDAQQAGA